MPVIHRRMIYIGIDPGASGGMAVLVGERNDAVLQPLASLTWRDAWEWMEQFRSTPAVNSFAAIEANSGFQGDGRPGSRMYTFGASFGTLRGFLVAASIPFVEVSSRKWQGEFGLKKEKGEGDTSWKNRLKSRAQQLFPEPKIMKATADALLIAEWVRRARTLGKKVEGKR